MATSEYASKGLANGLGIPALVLGGLGFLGSLHNGRGLLGGLSGTETVESGLMAENAALKSEKYAAQLIAATQAAAASATDKLETKVDTWVRPLAQEAAANRERVGKLEAEVACHAREADLREQLVRSELMGQINTVAATANAGITALNGSVACLQATVAGITKTVVPTSAVCPAPMPLYNSWTAPATTTTTTG